MNSSSSLVLVGDNTGHLVKHTLPVVQAHLYGQAKPSLKWPTLDRIAGALLLFQ